MKKATVRAFSLILTGALTQYDMAEARREVKARRPVNIYRLGLLLQAAHSATERAGAFLDRDDAEAVMAFLSILREEFVWEPSRRGEAARFALAPLRRLEKQMLAWINDQKLPKYEVSTNV